MASLVDSYWVFKEETIPTMFIIFQEITEAQTCLCLCYPDTQNQNQIVRKEAAFKEKLYFTKKKKVRHQESVFYESMEMKVKMNLCNQSLQWNKLN